MRVLALCLRVPWQLELCLSASVEVQGSAMGCARLAARCLLVQARQKCSAWPSLAGPEVMALEKEKVATGCLLDPVLQQRSVPALVMEHRSSMVEEPMLDEGCQWA